MRFRAAVLSAVVAFETFASVQPLAGAALGAWSAPCHSARMEAETVERSVVPSKPYVVLVGMDFSEPAQRALRKALELASQRENAELHVACVVPHGAPKGRHPVLEDRWLVAESAAIEGVLVSLRARVEAEVAAFASAQPVDRRLPRRVVPHVSVDAPGLGLIQIGLQVLADVIVIGARGQGKAEQPLGSVAQTTLRHARCTVVLTQFGDED